MNLMDSRTRLVLPLAALLALVTSPFLALWWIVAGVVLGIIGAAMLPARMRTSVPVVFTVGIGLAVGGLIYVLIGLLINAL
jgi:hypothetical protein